MRCPACGEDNSERAKFCSECAAPLKPSEPSPTRQERKVVTVLFCDLVAFTSASEGADPEDVQARLATYHSMLRTWIERYGGTVEKFIGDAVMAVFGAPVAHEDDAERAVRAGLRIVEATAELNEQQPDLDLQVRIGVNTGEVLANLSARPERGEGFVTGDVVNTASRLQSAAPIGSVVVGEPTYAATSRVFAYEPLEPVLAKGKSQPVTLWRAGAPRARARLGADVVRSTDAPLVGRDLEVLHLRAVFDRVARDRSVHLMTITGEPGVGKSRLVAELFSYIDELTELITWRSGRCLPYGDGVTFWALGEIVKAHAGILDTDEAAVATAKLMAVLPEDAERSWLLARLLPLIGVTPDSVGSSASREESFSAWRRFLESFATTGPAVLVVEDIHWADPALLQFLEYLTSWTHGVPLLLVCTARPELFDAHPGWGSGVRNSLTLNVSPLTPQDTATVVSHLLGLRLLPATTQELILERAEGNPLWAEECVRMLRDQNLIDAQGRLRTNEVPLPHGIQAMIAARLDTLPVEHKVLLADAAVIGRVFWADAVVALGRRDLANVTVVLHELTEKEFVEPHRESTLAGQAEYRFWHGLVRDVAYQMLPRPARAAKHWAASQWVEQQAGNRVVDVAEILVEHTRHALDLAQTAGDSPLMAEVTPAARRYATLAAHKTLALDSARAIGLLDWALSLTPSQHDSYPDVLVLWGRAAIQVGRLREAAQAFKRAANRYKQRNDLMSAGAALRQAAHSLMDLGDPSGRDLMAKSLRLLKSQGPSAELGLCLLATAISQFNSGALEAARTTVQEVEPLVTGDDPELLAQFHMARGATRSWLGDAAGLTELEDSIQMFINADLAHRAAVAYYNLAEVSRPIAGPEVTLRQLDSGEEFCDARGLASAAAWLRIMRVSCLAQVGRLREALAMADAILPGFEQAGDDQSFAEAASWKALILLEINGSAERVAEQALQAARRTEMTQSLAMGQTAAALHYWAVGDPTQAGRLLAELRHTTDIEKTAWAASLHQVVACAVGIGHSDLAREFVTVMEAASSPIPANQLALQTALAELAHAEGDYSTAVRLFTDTVRRWGQLGSRLEQAHALFCLAKSCLAAGQDASQPLHQARTLFIAMGAGHRVRRCNELFSDVADAQSAS